MSLTLGKRQNQYLSANFLNDRFEAAGETTTTQSAGLNYQYTTTKNTTYSLGTNGFMNMMGENNFSQYNICAGMQQTLLKKRIQLGVQLQYGITPDGPGQNMKGLSASFNFKATKHLQLAMRANARTYGSLLENRQTRVNISIRYNF